MFAVIYQFKLKPHLVPISDVRLRDCIKMQCIDNEYENHISMAVLF